MKAITMAFMMIFLAKGCSDESKKDLKTAVVEYTANTRGYYLKIVVKDEKMTVSKERSKDAKPTEVKLSDVDKKALISAFNEINLEELPDLKSPTEKRLYDGAAMAELKIIYQDKSYQTQTFDHGNPPVEIEKFVTKLVAVATQE